MATLSRKQRDLQKREELIVEATRDLLLNKGYHGLTMDRIAGAIEYSKGTIYQHFSCKEEVLAEMAIRLFEKRLSMFERAATFRMTCASCRSSRRRSSTRRFPRQAWFACALPSTAFSQVLWLALCVTLSRRAISYCLLETAVEQLPFGLWAITDGGYATILRDIPLYEIGIRDPFTAVIRTCEVLGDGYGWRPLTSEWDYAQTRQRLRDTIFAEEYQQLNL
jgi:AcrR family transcriptional regulator